MSYAHITLQSFLLCKVMLLYIALIVWLISIFLQNTRRPAALCSQRWAKGLCHPAYSCPYGYGEYFSSRALLIPVTLTPYPLVLRLLGRSSLLCCMTLMTAIWRPFHINLGVEAPRKLMNWARELVMSRPTVIYGYHPPLHRRERSFSMAS